MKYLYKYPQAAFPYEQLVEANRQRNRGDLEYELLDTGVFDDNRYCDILVEYAKATPDDILIRITASNRGPEAAELHLLPTLWFRNTWSWEPEQATPRLCAGAPGRDYVVVAAEHPSLWVALAVLRRDTSAAVHRKQLESLAPVRHSQRDPVRQGRHQRLRCAWPAGGYQPGAGRHQSGRRTIP